jgi:hypothetical protein
MFRQRSPLDQGLQFAQSNVSLHRGHATVGARKQPIFGHKLQRTPNGVGHFLWCLDLI